jgi:hypothetical protein
MVVESFKSVSNGDETNPRGFAAVQNYTNETIISLISKERERERIRYNVEARERSTGERLRILGAAIEGQLA